ncbi:hypothetical protein BLNAU_22489 [Blattamonas nauphoetae]|uniref:Uncharacterized protein n=1 Tax=Blattamonas nauphoetae TaxID=2049346 RepID=A0ABQ9WX44_9EUKA|nr:hypothetical protein BLNAU_22489 [Blattamonas nauphoetae]
MIAENEGVEEERLQSGMKGHERERTVEINTLRDDATILEEVRKCRQFPAAKPNAMKSSINTLQTRTLHTHVNDLLKSIGHHSPNPIPVFVDSIILLLSLPDQSTVNTVLSILGSYFKVRHLSIITFVSSKLIPRILSTPLLQDLSVIDDNWVLYDIIIIFDSCVWLASPNAVTSFPTDSGTDPLSIRDLVLHEVLIPMEPSLVQISRNRQILSWIDESHETLRLLSSIFEVSVFHQPTLNFICSSHIPMVYQSLLSEIEMDGMHLYVIRFMSFKIHKWNHDEAETWRRGRILLQTLEQEGFRDGQEQTLFQGGAFDIDRIEGPQSPAITMAGVLS